MQSQNIAILVAKTLFLDTLKDLIKFPFWWYTKGIVRAWRVFIASVQNAERHTAVLVWMKNITKPMFGQYDIWGRIISILIRIVQIIARSIVLIIWIMFLLLKVLFWILLPLIILSQIFYQFTGGFFNFL